AAMRGADLEARKAGERALENQVRQRNRSFERVADRVGQEAAAAEAAAGLQFPAAERVHENQDPELLGLGPDRMKFWGGELWPVAAAADREPAQPQSLDRMFELLDRELRVLQRNRRKSHETIGHCGAEFRKLFVLNLDQLGRSVALGAIPIGIYAERL